MSAPCLKIVKQMPEKYQEIIEFMKIGQVALTLLSIFGGKITTYRTLSEEVMDVLSLEFPDMKRAWTKNVPLPTCPVNLEEEPKDQDLKFLSGKNGQKRRKTCCGGNKMGRAFTQR